jgi:hypothetical protein
MRGQHGSMQQHAVDGSRRKLPPPPKPQTCAGYVSPTSPQVPHATLTMAVRPPCTGLPRFQVLVSLRKPGSTCSTVPVLTSSSSSLAASSGGGGAIGGAATEKRAPSSGSTTQVNPAPDGPTAAASKSGIGPATPPKRCRRSHGSACSRAPKPHPNSRTRTWNWNPTFQGLESMSRPSVCLAHARLCRTIPLAHRRSRAGSKSRSLASHRSQPTSSQQAAEGAHL